jgi:hypothetical protein
MALDGDSLANSLEKKEDLGKTPQAKARRWKLELKLADKRESAWRKKVSDIYKTYAPETAATNSFNILWTNTETLRQAVYNSLPEPQVRRRYTDADPLGKSVSEVLTRALEFAQETYDFDAVIKGDVLAMLLPGRSVSRVRYVPDIKQIAGEDSEADDDTQESEAYEEIDWEQVVCERIQWDDLRISAGKTWDEVCWVAFRHRFTREDCTEKFGEEIGKKVPLDSVEDEDVKKSKDVDDLFKTAEVWEIWDKDEKEVLWLCPTYPTILKEQDDPMELQGFFPIPRPLYAIENDQSLIPQPLYAQYEQQAKELNLISMRINKIINALKVRGIYDSTLSELSELMKAGDNELIAAANVTALLERGGLEKAIWMMPIDTAAMVLKELYAQRDATKQVIYEITGISDIMRSASDPNETFGAQKIKTQWGTQRLQRMQLEVQRYIRDLVRLKAEIIAEKFQPATLEAMTLVSLPHQAQLDQQYAQQMGQYQQAMQQYQMQMHQPAQPGQPPQQPPPQPPQKPVGVVTWEAVVKALHDDATRTYRVDIETDSTLSASQESDMTELGGLIKGIGGMFQALEPLMQNGGMPIETVKELMLSVVRRAKLGSAVEDAIEKMQQPKPQDPNAGQMQIEQMKAQAAQQTAQMNAQVQGQQAQAQMQHEAQLEQMKAQLADQQHQREMQQKAQADQMEAQNSMTMEQHKQEMQAQQINAQNQIEAQRDQHRMDLEAAQADREQQYKLQIEMAKIEWEREKATIEYRKAIEVAEIAAATTLQTAQASAAMSASKGEAVEGDSKAQASSQKATLDAVVAHLSKPKRIVRGTDGKVVGIE